MVEIFVAVFWSGLFGLAFSVWSGLVCPGLVFLPKLGNYLFDLAEILCVKYSAQNLIVHKI